VKGKMMRKWWGKSENGKGKTRRRKHSKGLVIVNHFVFNSTFC
jgi:hypothetical protein